MSRKSHAGHKGVTRRTVSAGLGAGALAGIVPFSIVRAQSAALKVGVLLPRSGVQAGIGQDCQRGVDIAPGILKELGLPALEIMNGDTETKVEIARSRAEKLISEGAQILIGAFDSGRAPRSLKSPSKRASHMSSTSPPPRRLRSRATNSYSAISRPPG